MYGDKQLVRTRAAGGGSADFLLHDPHVSVLGKQYKNKLPGVQRK